MNTDFSVQDVMNERAPTVMAETALEKASELLLEQDLPCLPVIDRHRQVIGIVTRTDFFSKGIPHLHVPSFINVLRKTTVPWEVEKEQKETVEKMILSVVRDIMTADCVAVAAHMNAKDFLAFMVDKRLRVAPVVDEQNTFLGTVTLFDAVAKTLGKEASSDAQ